MAQVGRNERCPCGSGKKFKHCCLLEQIKPSQESLTSRRLGRLADWIAAKFRSQIPAQADEFFFEFDAEEREILNSGTHAGANGVSTLVTDFICIDGLFELRGQTQTGLDWFLELAGPFSLEDREFYQALSLSGLRAYQVLSVEPGLGMELLDLFAPEMENGFVHEKLGSTQIAVGDVIGGRLIFSDGVMQIAAMVPFQVSDADTLLENYIEDLASARAQAGFLDDADDDFENDDDNDDEMENVAEFAAAIDRYALMHSPDGEAVADSVSAVEIDSDEDQIVAQLSEGSEALAEEEDGDEAEDDDEFEEDSMRSIAEEMMLEDMVAAKVVATLWLDSVLNSLVQD
jgi:hypothetical protein